ncbi:MAG: BrnT family toxin [Deltaproteobacteria bacterium]|nr:BrnT family toxin [Deltaproteobacteria bacterium]
MLFVWDPEKAGDNIKKHGVSFEIAQTIFDDPFHLSVLDAKDHDEERWTTIGQSAHDKTLVVVHTYSIVEQGQEFIRIISARKATKQERRQYEEGI